MWCTRRTIANQIFFLCNVFVRSLQLLALPVFLISIILWAVLFIQFWKRKNFALLARWIVLLRNCMIITAFISVCEACLTCWLFLTFIFSPLSGFGQYRWKINYSVTSSQGYRFLGMEWSSQQSSTELVKTLGNDKSKEKEAYQRYEWLVHLKRFRNDALFILSLICLQLPFELAYAHLYEVIGSDVLK